MKLLFSPETKSIVLHNKGKYYDMRNGKEVTIKSKLPLLRPYSKQTMSKPEDRIPKLAILKALKITLLCKDGKFQLKGNYPRYFWKGFTKLSI